RDQRTRARRADSLLTDVQQRPADEEVREPSEEEPGGRGGGHVADAIPVARGQHQRDKHDKRNAELNQRCNVYVHASDGTPVHRLKCTEADARGKGPGSPAHASPTTGAPFEPAPPPFVRMLPPR